MTSADKKSEVVPDSSWQSESPCKEELETLPEGNDLRLEGSSVRQAFKAGKASDWPDFLKMTSSTHGQT